MMIYDNPVYYNIWYMNYNAQYSDPVDKEDFICGMMNINRDVVKHCNKLDPYVATY